MTDFKCHVKLRDGTETVIDQAAHSRSEVKRVLLLDTRIDQILRIDNKPTLETLLESWTVFEPGAWENDDGPKGWYAVSSDEGIVAYFRDEDAAFRFRLDQINLVLNPPSHKE